jgi:hypothetical protein
VFVEISLPNATINTTTRDTAARHERCSFLKSTCDRNAHNVTGGVYTSSSACAKATPSASKAAWICFSGNTSAKANPLRCRNDVSTKTNRCGNERVDVENDTRPSLV